MKKVLILMMVVISFLNSNCSIKNEEEVSAKNKSASDVHQLIKKYNLQPIDSANSPNGSLNFNTLEEADKFLQQLEDAKNSKGIIELKESDSLTTQKAIIEFKKRHPELNNH